MHDFVNNPTDQCDGLGLREALLAEVHKAERIAGGETELDPHRTVHEIRKTLKDNRALLRLAMQSSGHKKLRKEEKQIRDLGRQLAEARDADVRVALLEGNETGNGLREKILDQLRRERDQAYETLEKEQTFSVLNQLLADMHKRQAELPVDSIGRKDLLRGIRQTYASCRNELRGLKPGSPMIRYHELRKHVKHLRRQLLYFEGSDQTPAYQALSELSTLLGQDHDENGLLQLLRAEKQKAAHRLARRLRDEKKALIRDNRKWLLGQARAFFAARPKAFAKNVKAAVKYAEPVAV